MIQTLDIIHMRYQTQDLKEERKEKKAKQNVMATVSKYCLGTFV